MRAMLCVVLAGLIGLGPRAAFADPAPAPSALVGDWDGTLHTGAADLRLALHVKTGATGLAGTLDSIDQGVSGLPLSEITVAAGKVRFVVNAPGGVFAGVMAADNATITGAWTQSGASLQLVFARRPAGATQTVLLRPQEPAPPFPYEVDAVRFASPKAGADLAGTLTLPPGAGPFPAAILISGSGPNDRDELVAGHKPFLVIADYLTRHGIAVLRYDKRGIGGSGGDYAHATSADFAADAAAAVAFLRARSKIDPARIGLIGHSEGGLVAPMVAAADPRIAFVVLMAGPGVDGATILRLQSAAIMRAAGADEGQIARAAALNSRIYAAVEGAKNAEDAAARVSALLAADPAFASGAAKAGMNGLAAAVSSDWFRFFLSYDPLPALRRVRCPILVLGGAKDLQVPPDANLPPIRAALADNRNAEVDELPGLNHLFQSAQSGSPSEYSRIEETISPPVLARLADWIALHDY